jgi:hypothetical protein
MPLGDVETKPNLNATPLIAIYMEIWPSKTESDPSSPPEKHSLAQVRHRSCGARFSISARVAASRATSRSTLGIMPQLRTRPEGVAMFLCAMFLLISEGSCCILPSVTEKSYEQAAGSCPWHA